MLIALGYLLGLVVPSPPATTLIAVLVTIGLVRRLEAKPELHGHEMLVLGAGYAAALFGRSVVGALDAILPRLPWDIAAAAACWFAIVRRRMWSTAPDADAFRLPSVPAVMGADGLRVAWLIAITCLAWLQQPPGLADRRSSGLDRRGRGSAPPLR